MAAVTMVAYLQGRILVLETKPQQNKLHIVCEKETRGAVYTITGFQVQFTPLCVYAFTQTVLHFSLVSRQITLQLHDQQGAGTHNA